MEENKAVVVDASVVFGFFFEEELNPYSLSFMDCMYEKQCIVSSIFPLEIANVLHRGIRNKRWSSAEAWRFLTFLSRFSIDVETGVSNDPMECLDIAEEYDLTPYDASYLVVAKYKKLPLATQDKELQRAAKECGVFWEPEIN